MPPKRKQPPEGTPEKVAKLDVDYKWDEVRECGGKWPEMFFRSTPSATGRTKAIGFDIDWTIIQTASGKKFATGKDDWKWWNEAVPKKLRELDSQGFRIVFFSNQGGIEKGKATIAELHHKVDAIIAKAGIDIFAFMSTGENHYRKPSTEMWDYFASNCNGGVKLNLSECKYVGDAAGRAKNWAPNKSKDFSCTDRMFGANIGVGFETPEEFFLGHKAVMFEWGSLDPASVQIPDKADTTDFSKKGTELVVLMGMPASGKSSFYRHHFQKAGYVHVNRDTLGTPAKCLKVATESLGAGKSVVVDNTNPTKAARAEYIRLAKEKKVPCRLFHLETSKEMSRHLNYVRQNQTKGKVRRIPDVGYHVYNKNFEAPTKAEGFSEVTSVKFLPHFAEEAHKKLFLQWTA